MKLKAEHIFWRVTPYRVVADLKLPLENRNGVFFTPHPKFPEYWLELRRSELVGLESNSPTPGCNLFDFLALYFGSYEEAVDYMNRQYFNLAMMPTGITLGSVRDEMVESLRNERQQFEDILALREPFRRQSEQLLGAYLYCRRLELSKDHAWVMFYVARGGELNQLLHYSSEHFPTLNPNQWYWVFPYFKDHHSFACLQIHDEAQNFICTVRLNPTRYMAFGLHSCLPDNKDTWVFGTREEALKFHGYAMKMGDFRVGFVHILFDPDQEALSPPMSSGVFLVSEATEFNTVVNNRSAFVNFRVADSRRAYADDLPNCPWAPYAINQIITAIKQDHDYSPEVAAMVASLKSDPAVLNLLIQHLESHNQTKIVKLIRKEIEPQAFFMTGEIRVLETSTGYVVKNSDTGSLSYLTNFLIQIHHTVWFEESHETYFGGRVVLNSYSIPFLISNEELQKPMAILTKAQQAVNQAGVIKEVTLPMIIDPTFRNALVAVLAQQTGNKPKLIGVGSLGWNSTKSGFTAPAWTANLSGLQPTSKILHPRAQIVAQHFDFQDFQILEDYSHVPAQARYLIALVAASLVRSFLNQQIPVVPVLRSPQSLEMLRAVFQPLGQIRPIELSSKRRQVEQILSRHNFSGYPVFATCPDPQSLDDLNYPLFLLGDYGVTLHEAIDGQAVNEIASLSKRIVTALVLKLLREPVQAHGLIEKQTAPSVRQLALEGKRVIEEICGLENFDLLEPEMPLLHLLLSRMSPSQAQEYFRCDMSANLLYIRCRLLQEVTRKPLYHELRAKNPEVKLHGDHYIACPAAWFLDILEKFYGRPVPLHHQPTDPGALPESQSDSEPITTTAAT